MSKVAVTFLGTVSPYCKGESNCPGYLVESDGEKFLLDCGNGIASKLKFPDCLENLHVFITHFHKDHFGDLGSLQYASYVYHNLELLHNKIDIFLPRNDIGHNKEAIESNMESYSNYIDVDNYSRFKIRNAEISFRDNRSHTIESYMMKLKIENITIVYTSDVGTSNFHDLVEFCRCADLLICESSFLKKHKSPCKTHLTAYDAGVLASKAAVSKLVLTHTWPEEDKNEYLKEAKKTFENVMVVSEGDCIEL